MRDYEIGEEVICIDNYGCPYLTEGKRYLIIDFDAQPFNNMVVVEDDYKKGNFQSYFPNRFIRLSVYRSNIIENILE